MSNLDPLFLDIFLDIYKCPFCPLCVGVLKHEMRNTEKWVCDYYALKTHFSP